MGDYAAFHYLNHKDVDPIKAVYVESKPLAFGELYSPRDGRIVIHKGEKSYWRTRDRVEFELIEDRSAKLLVITCRSIASNENFRTIFLNLESLYFELESKARENREPLFKKKDKKLDDKLLQKAITDYVLARLNIGADPIPWPTSFPIVSVTSTDVQGTERMCTFEKLSSDVYTEMEVCCPVNFVVGSIANTKLSPTCLKEVAVASESASASSVVDNQTVESKSDNSNINVIPVAVTGTVPIPVPSKVVAKKLNSVVPLNQPAANTKSAASSPASSTIAAPTTKVSANKSTKKVTPL